MPKHYNVRHIVNLYTQLNNINSSRKVYVCDNELVDINIPINYEIVGKEFHNYFGNMTIIITDRYEPYSHAKSALK